MLCREEVSVLDVGDNMGMETVVADVASELPPPKKILQGFPPVF